MPHVIFLQRMCSACTTREHMSLVIIMPLNLSMHAGHAGSACYRVLTCCGLLGMGCQVDPAMLLTGLPPMQAVRLPSPAAAANQGYATSPRAFSNAPAAAAADGAVTAASSAELAAAALPSPSFSCWYTAATTQQGMQQRRVREQEGPKNNMPVNLNDPQRTKPV